MTNAYVLSVETATWGHTHLSLFLALLLVTCMSLIKSLNLSEPQYPLQ